MPSTKINRRTVLRGMIAGTAVSFGLPPLEAMFNANGTAYAAGGALPRRIGVFFWGNGVKLDRWTPTTTGPAWTPNVENAPLMPVKDYVNIVSGTSVKTGNEQGHHAGAVGILSGCPMVKQPANGAPFRSTFSAPSIDQVAAAVIGTSTKFKSLEVGISKAINNREGTTLQYLSHNGPDLPNPAEYDPAKLYSRVFGSGFTPPNSAPVVDVTVGLRKSVMDAVLADLNSLRANLSAADKIRIDQHMTNVRTIENRLSTSAVLPAACTAPTMPGAIASSGGQEPLEQYTKAMSGLLAVALACDQTRVFSMNFSGPTASTVYWQVMQTGGDHERTHDESDPQPLVSASRTVIMTCLADLLLALKNIPEGAGNVLDNVAIMGSTDVADGRGHTLTDYPIIVAGGGGGFLKHPGVHYRSTTAENASTVLLSVLRAAGMTLTTFGAGGGLVTTSCTAIEA
ncbi:MAG TPA: DUF1552 domain-containing protein [Polyangiaceae bacterium]|nr:DUF1552 domain-containing protein [Polyangiaceae bacterium]